MPQVITATEARDHFAEIVNQVLYRGEEFIVEKQGKPAALITRPAPGPAVRKMTGTDFLLELTGYTLRGPKDFAKNLPKYAWE